MSIKSFFKLICGSVTGRGKSPQECLREEKSLRDHLTEKQIDKTIRDSFPASDPPAWTR